MAEVIGDLRKRFGLGRFVLVGDRGMKSAGSLAALEREGLGYLMGVQGRRNPEMEAALQAMGEEAWEACVGSDGTAKTNGSRVQEVTEKGGGERRFLVHSPEREGHERRLREAEQEKVREGLERLKARVAAGEFRRRAEREPDGGKDEAGWIGEAAGKILGSVTDSATTTGGWTRTGNWSTSRTRTARRRSAGRGTGCWRRRKRG